LTDQDDFTFLFKGRAHRRRAGFSLQHMKLLKSYFQNNTNPQYHDVRNFLKLGNNKKIFVNEIGKAFSVKQIVDKVRSMFK